MELAELTTGVNVEREVIQGLSMGILSLRGWRNDEESTEKTEKKLLVRQGENQGNILS